MAATSPVSARPIPVPSPILLQDNATWRFDDTCSYMLVLWTNTGGLLNVKPWVWVPPGRSLRISIDVGVQNEHPTCADIEREQTAGGTSVAGTVLLDLEGDGTFASMNTHVDGRPRGPITTGVFAQRDEPYLITAIWDAPNGNRIVNQMAVFAGTTAGVSINDASPATNSRDVQIHVRPEPGSRFVAISNDGGFTGAEVFDVAAVIPWRLQAVNAGLLSKVVYVRFLDADGRVISALSDDIVLDTVAPVLESATVVAARSSRRPARAVTLALSASDNRTGVTRVQVSAMRSGKGSRAARFGRTVTLDRPAGGVKFVRVRDGAGNWSKWRAVG